ncbi:lethal (2) 41Ab [Osmia lignaria lignaria]|uniref:lethal (2) 41Ab n=1 Tax=Osmia lignaria lignaria TaxID=1437193 RepID=UPI00402B96D1
MNKMECPIASTLNVLDPDDKLMKKFQTTLHTHLSRINNKLSEEILNLEASLKQAEKELKSEGIQLYQTQQEVERQHVTIKQYKEALTKITLLKKKRNCNIEDAKKTLDENNVKLKEEQNKKEKLSQELKNLLAFHNCLSKWEKDLNDYLIVSKQMSLQDANKNRMLINEKQQRDFILHKLKEEVRKIEEEIAYLDEQLQIKNKEKDDANKMIIYANTDLETLHRKHKDLHNIWKSIVNNIWKRNDVYDQLHIEQEEAHKSYNVLLTEIQKIKKETEKEMEVNEHLTSLSFRLQNNIKTASNVTLMYNEKITTIESQLINLAKINEQTQYDYNVIFTKYQKCLHEEEQTNRKLETIFEKKKYLEDTICEKLEEKIISNKTAKYVTELLINTKNSVLNYEISVAHIENTYGNNLLELEKLSNFVQNEKTELHELLQNNVDKEKQIDKLEKEIRKYEFMVERKQTKLLEINKLIDEIVPNIGSEELSPQDLKINSLEKNIQEIEQNIQKTQQFWIRQQGFIVSLSQQRESQLRELNLLEKEIMIMRQKNLKLNYALEMLVKKETSTNKAIAFLDKKLSFMNANLTIQKDLKKALENKNCRVTNESILSFQEFELELVKLQSDLSNLDSEKNMLKEELKCAQQESLSWKKKVLLIQETIQNVKQEHSTGDIALMKSEIHKMETRLSYLKKIQEKLIHDMDLCVTRRDIMINKVLSKLNRNPKEKHNKKVVMCKRLSGQQAKIKQLLKVTKQINNMVEKLNSQIKNTQSKIVNCQELLQNLKEPLSNIENEIEQLEKIKYHNLHSLVLKQRKARQLHDIKNGTYRMIYKGECIIEENLQKEHSYREYLKYVLQKTDNDFPMMKDNMRKILLTLQVFEEFYEYIR